MYRFKRNAVQGRVNLTQTPWTFGGTLANVDTPLFDMVAPQIQSVTANETPAPLTP